MQEQYVQGDSYLAIAQPAIVQPWNRFDITTNTPDGHVTFEGLPNSAGFLGKFQCTVEASNFRDALFKATRTLAPALSNISAQLDTPVEIRQTDAVELRTGATTTRIITAPPFLALAIPPAAAPSEEYRAYASLYREAMSTMSLRYRFLSFYKVIDAIYARRRRIGRAARTPERAPTTLTAGTAWLKAIFPPPLEVDDFILENTFPTEILGKKFGNIFQQHLLPIRTRIAHAVLNSGDLVVPPDDPDEEREIIKWLPLAKCMARRLLKNDFPTEFLSFLAEDGTVRDTTAT